MEIPIPLGIVLIVVFLFNELLVNPFFETVKNRLLIVRLRRLLRNGRTLQVAPEHALANKFGLSTGVRANDTTLAILKILKAFVKLFVLVSIAWWESGLSQITVTTSRDVRLQLDALSRSDGSASFASVTPHVPLAETQVISFPFFNAVDKENTGAYTKRRNTQVELRYFSDCVEDEPDSSRVVFGALVRRNPDVSDETQTACLNGHDGREVVKLLSFDPVNDNAKATTIESMNFIRSVATDNTSTLYAVKLRTPVRLQDSTQFEGYATLTARSHFDNNVGWSIYGYALAPNKELLRIMIVVNDIPIDGGVPCRDEECIGIWNFSSQNITLPSGTPLPGFHQLENERGNQLESVGLVLKPVTPEQDNAELGLILAWLAETDYATFKADERFIDDIMNRLTGNVFFFSDIGVEERAFRAFDSKSVTQIEVDRTWPLLASMIILIVFALGGVLAELRSRKKLGIRSEIVSREALIGMYKSHFFCTGCCHSNSEIIDIGIIDQDIDGELLGIIDPSAKDIVTETEIVHGLLQVNEKEDL